MRLIVTIFCVSLVISSCKKKPNEFCPEISDDHHENSVDLTPVTGVKQIMDTLAKYPELQVTYAEAAVFTHGSESRVSCNVYFNGVILFNTNYSIAVYNDT